MWTEAVPTGMRFEARTIKGSHALKDEGVNGWAELREAVKGWLA